MRSQLSTRTVLALIVLLLASVALKLIIRPSTAAAQSSLNPTLDAKYLVPAEITKLDWLLLKAELQTLSKLQHWDDYGLIESITVYHCHPSRGLVGITFLVNNERYIKLSDETARKAFAQAVAIACSLLVVTIPEVKDGENTYANFVSFGGATVAEYSGGKVTLKK